MSVRMVLYQIKLSLLLRSSLECTIAKDSKAQEIQVALALHGVPADVRVAFGHEHGTALETAAGQVLNHLQSSREPQKC